MRSRPHGSKYQARLLGEKLLADYYNGTLIGKTVIIHKEGVEVYDPSCAPYCTVNALSEARKRMEVIVSRRYGMTTRGLQLFFTDRGQEIVFPKGSTDWGTIVYPRDQVEHEVNSSMFEKMDITFTLDEAANYTEHDKIDHQIVPASMGRNWFHRLWQTKR